MKYNLNHIKFDVKTSHIVGIAMPIEIHNIYRRLLSGKFVSRYCKVTKAEGNKFYIKYELWDGSPLGSVILEPKDR